jgi:hypothetical protein
MRQGNNVLPRNARPDLFRIEKLSLSPVPNLAEGRSDNWVGSRFLT